MPQLTQFTAKSSTASRLRQRKSELVRQFGLPENRVGGWRVNPKMLGQREHLWAESIQSRLDRLVEEPHPLLHTRLAAPTPTWITELSKGFYPWLADHVVSGAVLFPDAGFAQAALGAAQMLERPSCVENLVFERPLIADERAYLSVSVDERGAVQIQGSRNKERPWTRHAHGRLGTHTRSKRIEKLDLAELSNRCSTVHTIDSVYERLAQQGLAYGRQFRALREIRSGDTEVLARVACDASLAEDALAYGLHPTLLDAAFQALIAALDDGHDALPVMVPTGIRDIRVHGDVGTGAWVYGRITDRNPRSFEGDIVLTDDDGQVLVEVRTLRCQALADEHVSRSRSVLHEHIWQAAPGEPVLQTSARGWLLLGADTDFAKHVGANLAGQRSTAANSRRR